MYLQLAGHTPLHNAENPLSPGAKTYEYDKFYLGQGQDIILPDALYKTSAGGFVDALNKLKKLYQDFQDGKKPTPANVAARAATAQMPNGGVQPASTIQPLNGIGATIALLTQAIPYIVSILGTISATLVNNKITNKYNQNAYNVQGLNNMNIAQLNLQIQRLDMDIAAEMAAATGGTAAPTTGPSPSPSPADAAKASSLRSKTPSPLPGKRR